VDGLEDEVPPVDFDPLGMDDNLHPHDLKHAMVGERRHSNDRRQGEGEPPGEERRKGARRDHDEQGEEQ
jgi:C4-dicarboxylate transporter DctQ subunit